MIVFLIPVRGGSRGVPGKNLREVGGLSLIARAVRAAQAAARLLGESARVVIDSEAEALRAEGRRFGAETPYVRPADLATDTASSMDVVRHALTALTLRADDLLVLIQATSPLTPPAHIADVVRAARASGQPALSVAACDHHPAWSYALQGTGEAQTLLPLLPHGSATRRQDLPEAVRASGAAYAATAGFLRQGAHFLVPGTSRAVLLDAAAAIDIDRETDLCLADALLRRARPAIAWGTRRIGGGASCYIIAEAGVNHDGDLGEAHRLVDAAAAAGADAVKFQTWRTELLVRPGARTADYQQAATGSSDQFAMLKKLELPEAWHGELRDHAQSLRIDFLSTPDEIVSARFLAGLGLPGLKIGSAELDNLPFLHQVAALAAARQQSVLLSTGMADLAEVAAAVDLFQAAGAPLALFHCVSSYPAPLAAMNVRAIATLRAAFGVPAGLSDHCPSVEPALAAVGLGLDLWEKHLTCDPRRAGPDHAMSLPPDEMRRQIAAVRAAECALGDGSKRCAEAERGTRAVVRKRLHAARDLAPGTRIAADDLLALRGESGLPVSAWSSAIGRRLCTAVAAGEALTGEQWEH